MGRWRCSIQGAFASCILLLSSIAVAFPTSPECPTRQVDDAQNVRVASYRIVASLDTTTHRVDARSRIHWINPSNTPTNELYLHAYMNAFSHPKTRFMRFGSHGRSGTAALSAFGNVVISRLVAHHVETVDLLPFLAPHSPADPDDATDLRIALPFEVSPGQSLTLDLDFQVALPSLLERAGFSGSFHAIAQWFPKLARRDRAGAWQHFAYHALAEFSSDFGDYDVTLDTPEAFVVAAPGALASSVRSAGRRIERYCVSNVHDFAWFAWDRFVVSKSQAGPVQIRHYAPPNHERNAAATLDTAIWGLHYYGARYSAYPYRNLTIVHPPDEARGAAGMEYPQLITTGGPWYLPYLGARAVDSVTLHELAHQWFHGVVATDEYLWPVLDEGLASWAEIDALAARYPSASILQSRFLSISEAAYRRVLARSATRRGPLAIPAEAFGDFSRVAAQIYARFPTLLETISRVYAPTVVQQALDAYVRTHRFSAPDPKDFVDAVRHWLPAAATAAIASALFEDGWVDYAVTRIDAYPKLTGGEFVNRVLLERRGSFDLPVFIEFVFADGHVARRRLESVGSTTWIEWPRGSPLVCVTIDPDHLITIDDDLGNQTLRVDRRPFLGRLAGMLHVIFSTVWTLGWP